MIKRLLHHNLLSLGRGVGFQAHPVKFSRAGKPGLEKDLHFYNPISQPVSLLCYAVCDCARVKLERGREDEGAETKGSNSTKQFGIVQIS